MGISNIDIRIEIQKSRFRSYQIAGAMGMSETSFSRMLRRELPQSKKEQIFAAIERLASGEVQPIKNAPETGQLSGIRTESGHWKIDVADTGNKDVATVLERLDRQERLLRALCGHLGIAVQG